MIKKLLTKHCRHYIENETNLINIDNILLHDGSLVLVEKFFSENKHLKVKNPERVTVCFDHIYPANNAMTGNLQKKAREFIKSQYITDFYEGGSGICHQVMLEKNLKAGTLLVGGDSHTPTIGAKGILGLGMGATDIIYALLTGTVWLENPKELKIHFSGQAKNNVSAKDIALYIIKTIPKEVLDDKYVIYTSGTVMSLDCRAVICNMAPEMGCITALFNLGENVHKKETPDITINLADVTPQIALPHDVINVRDIAEREAEETKIDVVVIGTCTGGRLEDLAIAANQLSDTPKHPEVRLIVIPASRYVYQQAIKQGIIDIFLANHATILPPGCGPCLGQANGVLADGEICVSTGNRNFKGRMGNANASIYLVAPLQAAKIAGKGVI
ncbi:3-isopropylmalate dehydratase large subunit [Salmonella enterica subsp. enterica serovar Sandiego]|nr:3-isopropylmalate dehydratase large subunit [Salmonella enterica subsp. enterica serovar Sandiego]